MIIIPEIETVVILIPRTGTRSLRTAVTAQYPKAFLLYRHMEADGVPCGYDRWNRVTIIRDPVERLWSLYKFLRKMEQEPHWTPGYAERMRASAAMPFDGWVVNNDKVFTAPYDGAGSLKFYPQYTIKHSLPENRKSQYIYARPDLGVRVYRERERQLMYEDLHLRMGPIEHATDDSPAPMILSQNAAKHICTYFRWDLDNEKY